MVAVSADILLEGLWPAAPEGLMIQGVVTDNRKVTPGCIFVAIKGERTDGHLYAPLAFNDGAALIVAQHPVEGVPAEVTVLVQDPLDAMIVMGGNYRRQFSPLVLGVTGSVGKTTTKEFCAAVFSDFGVTLKTEGNQNNEIGMPNTLFRLDESVQYAVIEMGMQALGEIYKLSLAAQPHGAIITQIGTAHMESLGSQENILRAKMEICDGLPDGAPLVLNGDDALLWRAQAPGNVRPIYAGIDNEDCQVRARNIRRDGAGQYITIRDAQFGSLEAYVPALGRHNIYNALYAYTAATRLGLEAGHAAAALAQYRTTGMRQNIVDVRGIVLIEDCYNASPESMAAALATLAEMETGGKRIAVLGDMKELGNASETAHAALGALCGENGIDILITVGDLAALAAPGALKAGLSVHICQSNAQAAALLCEAAQAGDAVLVKASRSMQFEEILESFKNI